VELIPVLDLMHGVAVHARGGVRHAYRPVQSKLLAGSAGYPVALARVYRAKLGATSCYVADLDAIEGRPPQNDLIRALASPIVGFGKGLLVDAAVTGPDIALGLIAEGASQVIVGLETLGGLADLKKIVQSVGGERVIFSLDLKDGKPIHRGAERIANRDNVGLELGARAAEAGCAGVLVLDIAAVGSGGGPRSLDLIDAFKRLLGVRVYSGGGVRSEDDLRALETAGCDAVLLGTALHDGSIVKAGEWGRMGERENGGTGKR
jgi:phosphoribosylformimino-5-aminoimidazole carboxamide ribotide isomerase